MAPKIYHLAPNQTEIQTSEGIYFQSYNTIIAFKPANNSPIQLDAAKWDYSKTTGKYRNQFLGEEKKETLKKIARKEYVLVNLN